MTKEEIALQLAVAVLNNFHSDRKMTMKAEEVADFYNIILANINLNPEN